MKKIFQCSLTPCFSLIVLLLALLTFSGCDNDDPKPVNEEEVITTVELTLVPEGSGIPVTLKFFDADGEQGSIAPLVTVSGPLKAGTVYSGVVTLWNETENPPVNITDEVAEEAESHLFCFAVSGDLTIGYGDQDANGDPVGLLTTWEVGDAGTAQVTLSLRHQAGTKTGECPGGGETDVQIVFELNIS